VADPRKAAELIKASPINPRTGKVWSLNDAELKAGLAATQRNLLKTRESALQFLKDAGFVTAKGRLARKYGGK
jgi:hypothetical protein